MHPASSLLSGLRDVVPCGPTQAGISDPFCESHLHHSTDGVWQRISQDAATEGLLGPLLREATGLGNQISSSPEPTSTLQGESRLQTLLYSGLPLGGVKGARWALLHCVIFQPREWGQAGVPCGSHCHSQQAFPEGTPCQAQSGC